jgi:hypothetical protein
VAIILLAAISALTTVFFRLKTLKDGFKRPSRPEIVMLAAAPAAACVFFAMYKLGAGQAAAPAASALYFFAYNFSRNDGNKTVIIFETLFILAIVSAAIAPAAAIKPAAVPVSFLAAAFAGSAVYKNICNKSVNIFTEFLNLFLLMLVTYGVFLSNLPVPASITCAAITAVFYNIAKEKDADYFADEKREETAMLVVFSAMMAQCFIIILIFRNPLL